MGLKIWEICPLPILEPDATIQAICTYVSFLHIILTIISGLTDRFGWLKVTETV